MTRAELLQVAKPILFNTDMVMAILDDRKTVTRRVIKPQPKGAHSVIDCDAEAHTFDLLCGNGGKDGIFADWVETIKAPFWLDDILYVRETWQECCRNTIHSPLLHDKYCFKASLDSPLYGCIEEIEQVCKWRPSIHMPKEAARIFLRVTDVRVERLQDITDEQAKEEGANFKNGKNVGWEEKMRRTAVERFAEIWNCTIPKKNCEKYGWDANPWVWVTEFERVEAE